MESQGNQEQRFNALLKAYGEACVAPEPGANFMPQLWQKIEARQTFSFFFMRVARGFVTAAVAAALAMAVYLSIPRYNSVFYNSTYVDVLAASHADNSDLFDLTGYDSASSVDEL